MTHHPLHPTLAQQQVSQGQVEGKVEAHIVGHEIDAVQPGHHGPAHRLAVVDEHVVPLLARGQAATHRQADRLIAQIGAVAPQAGVDQGLEDHGRIGSFQRIPLPRQPLRGPRHLGLLLLSKGVTPLPEARLEITHRFQQTPVEKGLGKVPGRVEPSPAPEGGQFPIPQAHVRGVLGQGPHRLRGNLVPKRLQPPHDLGRIAIVLQGLADELRLALHDSLTRKGTGLGGHQRRRKLNIMTTWSGHEPSSPTGQRLAGPAAKPVVEPG